MDELTKIILNLNQDVKQIKDTQSFEGANVWLEKRGPELYKINNEDVNSDSIPDVIIVKNKKTNQNVIANGHTTDDSTYRYSY